MMARTPDLSCIWSLLTSKPRRESISSWFRMRSAVPPLPATAMVSAAAPSPAASKLSVVSLMSSAMGAPLLHEHLFEEHVAHAIGRGGRVDAAKQFFLQAHHTGRALEVVHARFAQIALEFVDDARHQRLHA